MLQYIGDEMFTIGYSIDIKNNIKVLCDVADMFSIPGIIKSHYLNDIYKDRPVEYDLDNNKWFLAQLQDLVHYQKPVICTIAVSGKCRCFYLIVMDDMNIFKHWKSFKNDYFLSRIE